MALYECNLLNLRNKYIKFYKWRKKKVFIQEIFKRTYFWLSYGYSKKILLVLAVLIFCDGTNYLYGICLVTAYSLGAFACNTLHYKKELLEIDYSEKNSNKTK